ncbi:MAG: alpha/beta hydrolase [Candidatus Hydrogenedentes bacterium]|nr:alpha/beta hydrolase [Candidatus Hydrogenedentota bacterium]
MLRLPASASHHTNKAHTSTMTPDAKENLVLVPSFPTNSAILEPVVDYLKEFFNVICIDLPGFHPEQSALHPMSLRAYVRFVENRITQLDVESFILGGLSFGYRIISQVCVDDRCKALLAIGPLLNSESLAMSARRKRFYLGVGRVVEGLRLQNIIWNSAFIRRLIVGAGHPTETLHVMFAQVNPRAFFRTARLILEDKEKPMFQDLPHVIILNQHDRTVRQDRVIAAFRADVNQLLVVDTGMDHYPRTLSRAYFEEHMPETKVRQAMQWVQEQQRRGASCATGP